MKAGKKYMEMLWNVLLGVQSIYQSHFIAIPQVIEHITFILFKKKDLQIEWGKNS